MASIAFQLAVSAWSARERDTIALPHHAELLIVGRCAVGGCGGRRRGLVSRRHVGKARVVSQVECARGCAGERLLARGALGFIKTLALSVS